MQEDAAPTRWRQGGGGAEAGREGSCVRAWAPPGAAQPLGSQVWDCVPCCQLPPRVSYYCLPQLSHTAHPIDAPHPHPPPAPYHPTHLMRWKRLRSSEGSTSRW